jgi:pyridoxine 4-dehydrogenase
VTRPGSGCPGAGRSSCAAQVEENLRQLGRDHLDLVNLRAYGPGPIGEHFGVLAELRQAGLIRQLGVSSVRPGQLEEAQAIAPVVCVQNRFSLDEHSAAADEFVRACGEQGIAFVPYFAIAGTAREAGAADGTGAGSADAALEAVARARGVTPAQVRLAWTLNLGPHLLAIPGTGDPGHLTENVAAAALRLTPDDMTRLSAP